MSVVAMATLVVACGGDAASPPVASPTSSAAATITYAAATTTTAASQATTTTYAAATTTAAASQATTTTHAAATMTAVVVATTTTATPTTTTSPPWGRLSPDPYLGAFMPSLQLPEEQYHLGTSDRLLDVGANAVMVGLIIPYGNDGTVKADRIDYPWLTTTIRQFHEAGLAVGVVLGPINVEERGEPGPVPPDIRSTLLEGLTPVVSGVAALLEANGVEVFAPLNEVDYQLGVEAASRWSQEVRPAIRARFTGRLLWKGSLFEHAGGGPAPDIDFTGYDIVGFTLFPHSGIASYPGMVRNTIDNIRSWATEDGVDELWVAEFGSYEQVLIGRDEIPDSIRIVLEVGADDLDGFFVFDPPRGFGVSLGEPDLWAAVSDGFAATSG